MYRVIIFAVLLLIAAQATPIYLPLLEKPAATTALEPTETPGGPTPIAPIPTVTPEPTFPPDLCRNVPVDPSIGTHNPVDIVAVERANHLITLRANNRRSNDLTSYYVCSVQSHHTYIIPGTFTNVQAPTDQDLVLPVGFFNINMRDDAVLFDPTGDPISYFVSQ